MEDNKMLKVSSNPHVRDCESTTTIMMDVLIALIPTTLFGVYNSGDYRMYSALLIFITVTTCVLSELLFQKLLNKKTTINDLSAVVTGLLLALNLPCNFPLWMAVFGALFAIVVVKQIFGGIGQYIMNPALAARCFLFLSFTSHMTNFVIDGVTKPTPLAELKNGDVTTPLRNMFMGNVGGTLGETSTIAILIGAAYLLIRRIIDYRIPFAYIASFSVFILIFGDNRFDLEYLAMHLCGGGLMLGAFFMATDYVTAPITPMGKVIYGIILGVLTGLFRIFGPNAEGVSFAIIFGNILVPLIKKVTMPTVFGYGKKKKGGKKA